MEAGLSWIVPLSMFLNFFMETKGYPRHVLIMMKEEVHEDKEARKASCNTGVSTAPNSIGQSKSYD